MYLRYAVGVARGGGLTSPSDRYRKVNLVRRGRSDMHEGRQIKGARSDGRRDVEMADRYGRGEVIKYYFLLKGVPSGTLGFGGIIWFCLYFQMKIISRPYFGVGKSGYLCAFCK